MEREEKICSPHSFPDWFKKRKDQVELKFPHVVFEVGDTYPYAVTEVTFLSHNGKQVSQVRLGANAATAAAKSLQSCPTLSDSMDCSPPGSPVPGIFQARVLEWGAIAFSVGQMDIGIFRELRILSPLTSDLPQFGSC